MRYFVVAYKNSKIVQMGSFATRDKARAYVASMRAYGFTTKTTDRAAA